MKTVFLDSDSLGSDVDFTPIKKSTPSLTLFEKTTHHNLPKHLQGANIVITNKVQISGKTLATHPDIKCIIVTATGVNNIDLQAAKNHGVTVCNATAYGSNAVAQHTFCLILAITNRLLDYTKDVESGLWQTSSSFCLMNHPTFELEGKTLVLVGYGETGKAVARLAKAFGMEVKIAVRPNTDCNQDYNENRQPLDALLPEADILSLHCLLSDSTTMLINRKRLALMKTSALLINTARGGLVDEEALKAVLENGQIGGAAIDVLSTEPPPTPHLLLDKKIPNLIITPHMAWITRESRQRLINITAENIRAFIDGQPINVVHK